MRQGSRRRQERQPLRATTLMVRTPPRFLSQGSSNPKPLKMGSLRFSLRRTQVRAHLRTASAEVERAVERKRVEMEREAATLRSEGEKYRQGCLEALQLAEEKTRQYKALKEAGGSASDEVVALREWVPTQDFRRYPRVWRCLSS